MSKIDKKFKKRILKESKQLILDALENGILDESFKGISVTFHTDKAPKYNSYTMDELTEAFNLVKDAKGQKVFYKKERDTAVQLVASLFPNQVHVFQETVEVKRT